MGVGKLSARKDQVGFVMQPAYMVSGFRMVRLSAVKNLMFIID
jgi:hypothetical protein